MRFVHWRGAGQTALLAASRHRNCAVHNDLLSSLPLWCQMRGLPSGLACRLSLSKRPNSETQFPSLAAVRTLARQK